MSLKFKQYMEWFNSAESDIAPKEGTAEAAIQWKGTDVCMDILCSCGHREHIDEEFVYRLQCSECGKVFAVQSRIHLIEIPEEHQEVSKESCCIKF